MLQLPRRGWPWKPLLRMAKPVAKTQWFFHAKEIPYDFFFCRNQGSRQLFERLCVDLTTWITHSLITPVMIKKKENVTDLFSVTHHQLAENGKRRGSVLQATQEVPNGGILN